MLIRCIQIILEIIIPFHTLRFLTKYDKTKMCWMFWLGFLSIPTSAHASEVIHKHNLHPPFILDWSSAWIITFCGALLSLTFQKLDIERQYHSNPVAKVFLGFVSGLVATVAIDNSITPSGFAMFVGFLTSVLATPIVYGAYLYVSKPEKVEEIIDDIKDRGLGK